MQLHRLPTPPPSPLRRRATDAVEWNRLDARELAYHQKVAAGYQELIAQEPERWHIFDARQPVEELAEQIAQRARALAGSYPNAGADHT